MHARRQPASEPGAEPASPWMGHALSMVVLVASLVLVLAYWRGAQQRGLRDAEADFQATNRQVLALLQQRMINYELLVRGGASLQASLPQPSRIQWQRYVAGLDLSRRFPAVQALGFALDVQPGQLGALQQVLPGIAWGGASDSSGDATDDSHAFVLYVAPEVGDNLRARGLDLATLSGRQRALQLAAARGAPQMSEPVPGIAAAEGAPASQFAIFAPVFAEESSAVQARQATHAALRGWVFAQVDIAGFVAMGLHGLERTGSLRIVDAGGEGARTAYAERKFIASGIDALPEAERPAFSQQLPLQVMGRRWLIEFQSSPMEKVRERIPALRITLLGGLAGSLLVFGITLVLARTRARAQALAAQMSDSYRRSEQRFRTAMEFSAIGKALLDRDGRIVEANPAMAQLLGTSQQVLAGTTLGQHFVEGEDATFHTMERQALSEGAYRATRRLRRSDGDVRHASLTFATVPGERDESFASLVQVEDVTERLRAEARVQALNRTLEARVALRTRELSHANRELEAFAYSVSHDLRAPLRSIDGFSRLLGERYGAQVDATGQDYLQRIRNASARMSELIDALLKMSRISRGEMTQERIDLSAMAEEVAAELRNGDPARAVAFDIQPGMTVHGDPALLRNLLDNLLGNAWKFTRATPTARIQVQQDAQGEIQVRDNGAGFAPEYAAKLFRPFQRLHSQVEYDGNGIGLASVKRIVERHGGSIRAEGQVGQGATFSFRLAPASAEG